jgi:hypothetical protein
MSRTDDRGTTVPVRCLVSCPSSSAEQKETFSVFLKSALAEKLAWLARVCVDSDGCVQGSWELLLWDAPRSGTRTTLSAKDLGLTDAARISFTPYAFAQFRPVVLALVRKRTPSEREYPIPTVFASPRMALLVRDAFGGAEYDPSEQIKVFGPAIPTSDSVGDLPVLYGSLLTSPSSNKSSPSRFSSSRPRGKWTTGTPSCDSSVLARTLDTIEELDGLSSSAVSSDVRPPRDKTRIRRRVNRGVFK